MKYCCSAFEGHLDEAGKSGFAVFGEDVGDKCLFLLQWRSVDKESDLTAIRSPHPVALIGDMGLRYCPWCGVSLADFYSKSWKTLVRPGLRVPLG